jgi:hypothetical protein
MLRIATLLVALVLPVPSMAQGSRGQPEPWCEAVERSSFVNAVCYDERARRLSMQLGARWYRYCGVPPATVQQLLAARSIGSYFQAQIRGRYEC